MDSIPVVCITGQVPTHLIGNDAFQECDTVGITRPCTKHNWLVRDVERSRARPARGLLRRDDTAGPGPVVVDIPKDVQFANGTYWGPKEVRRSHTGYRPRAKGDAEAIRAAVDADGARRAADLLYRRRRHQFRAGGEPAAARARRG